MTAITLHLTNLNEVKLVEQLAKTLKVKFEKKEEESPYDPEFVAKILRSDEDVKNGRTHKLDLKNLWK